MEVVANTNDNQDIVVEIAVELTDGGRCGGRRGRFRRRTRLLVVRRRGIRDCAMET